VAFFPIWFVVVFTSASFLVSLAAGHGHFPAAAPALIFHMAVHAIFGAMAAAPTRRLDVVLAMALSAMLVDVDHLARFS
jgi:hypothetical protein